MEFKNGEKVKYTEILELYAYCRCIGINAELRHIFDGFKIEFPDGSDFIQHRSSYGCDAGCVEPAIGCAHDYSAVSLEAAVQLAFTYKNRLNGEAGASDV